MSVSIFNEGLDTEFTFERRTASESEDQQPFDFLLMGDWSGESNNNQPDLNKRKLIEIDRDNFDTIFRKIQPRVNLDFGNSDAPLSITFNEFDDFHPDNLFQQLPLFAELRGLRRKLKSNDTYEEAAREVRTWLVSEDSSASEKNSENDSSANDVEDGESSGSILDDILFKANKPVKTQNVAHSDLGNLIKNIVEPHIIHTDTAEQSNLLLVVDEVISDLMRKILHHPEFQKLESAWRGVFFIIKRVETDSDSKLYLLNVSKAELLDNLKSVNALTDSIVHKRLQDTSSDFGKNTWAAICANYSFDLNVDDAAALMRLGKIAEIASCPFISHINVNNFLTAPTADDPDIKSNLSDGSNQYKIWSMLRSLPESSYLGLLTPSLLGRLPYGEDTEPTENFAFDELAGNYGSENYLWLNPAFAFATLLSQNYREYGLDFPGSMLLNIENLPTYVYETEEGKGVQPATEFYFTESINAELTKQGVMPVVSFRNSEKVRLTAFQSISDASHKLKGLWNS